MKNKILLITGATLAAGLGLPSVADAKPHHHRSSSCAVEKQKRGHHQAKHRHYHKPHRSHSGLNLSLSFGTPVRSYRSHPVFTSTPCRTKVHRGTVARVQSRLNWLGYRAGYVDGYMGNRTSRAIAYYQRDNCLRVTGTITLELLRSLRI
jgi:hypothetical protein